MGRMPETPSSSFSKSSGRSPAARPTKAPTVTVTGHSRGGGLAGFVGELYGVQGTLFDNMTFNAAVNAAYQQSSGILPNNGGRIPVNTKLKELIYGDQAPFAPNPAGLSAFATTGELLSIILPARFTQTPPVQYLDSNAGAPRDPIDLHSMALLTLLIYAQVKQHTDWASIGRPLYDALYNSNLSKAVKAGLDNATMRDILGYSAITSGYEPFGTTAIQSLFNDADTLGRIQKAGQFTGLLSSQLTGSARSPVGGLTEIDVQFATDQAASAADPSNGTPDPSLANGAFKLIGSTTLQGNLDPSNWKSTFQTQDQSSGTTTTAILGVGDFFDGVLSNISARLSLSDPVYSWIADTLSGFSAPLLQQLNEITQIDIALTSGDLSAAGTLPKAHDGNPGGAMLVGADGTGSLTGSDKGNDVLISGGTVKTGNGNDLILGGGTETLTLGTGKNQILADSDDKLNLNLTYAGATGSSDNGPGNSGGSGGAPADASPGTDLIIGPAAGGGTYTFTDADKAAFTVVWDGAGKNTYDIQTSSNASSSVNVVELNMSGISGGNLTQLDMQKLENYVDKNYNLTQNDPTIVILNPGEKDTITLNGNSLTTPQSTLEATSWSDDDFAGADNSAKVLADEDIANQFGAWPITPDWENPLQYLTEQTLISRAEAAEVYTYADLYQFEINSGATPEVAAQDVEAYAAEGVNPLNAFAYLSVEGEAQHYHSIAQVATNTWEEDSETDKNYVLATDHFEYGLESTGASTRELSVLPAVAQITGSGGRATRHRRWWSTPRRARHPISPSRRPAASI